MTSKRIIFGIIWLSFLCVVSLSFAQEKFPFLAVVNKDNVNLRAGPNVNFEKLSQLTKGQDLVVVEKSYGWSKVRLPKGAFCFISEKFITHRMDDIYMVTGNRVNLRATGSEKANVIGKLSQGNRIRVKECANGWCRIDPIEGSFGWITDEFLSFKSDQVPSPEVVVEPSRSIYQKKQEAKREEPPKPEIFTAVGQLEDLGRVVPSKDIRYKLTVDEKTTYYLQGERKILDPFIHYKVKVQGTLRQDLKKENYPYPVVQVSQINLSL